MKKEDLNGTKVKLLSAIDDAGMTLFAGAYPSAEIPQIPWETDLDPDPCRLVQVAKSLGVKVFCLSWDYFDQTDIDAALIEHAGQEEQPSLAFNQEVKAYEPFVGQLAAIRAGFFHEGVFYVVDIDTAWYREFLMLATLNELPEIPELDMPEHLVGPPRFDSDFVTGISRGMKRSLPRKTAPMQKDKHGADEISSHEPPSEEWPGTFDQTVAKRAKKHTH